MATHDYVLDNATGANFRSDLNNALAAIVSNNSSSSEPSTKYAYQWWADTNDGVLKIRNSSNDGWVTLLQLDGTLTLEDGSNSAPALGFRDDLNTGIFSSAADTLDITCGGTTRGSFSSSGLTVTGNVTATTFVGNIDAVDGDFDGTLEADAITVAGVALATVIAGTTVTTATNANHVSVADNESTNENNLIPFIEDASATGNVGLESDGDFTYNPSTGTVTATVFVGNLTGNVTGNASGTAATVTGAAQTNITSLGTLTGLTLSGDMTFTGDSANIVFDKSSNELLFADDAKAAFGNNGDMVIRHDGNNSIIEDTGTGDLLIRGSDDIKIQKGDGSEDFIHCNDDASVLIFHDGNEKLRTASGGLKITGGVEANITALSDGATITIDMATASHHSVTLGGNRTFAAPSNQVVGQAGSIFITQDGTGSRTASFNSAFKFVGGTAPTLSTAAAAVDRIDYVILSSNVIHCAVSLDVK
tara:strand:+ start:8069 stop:9496 length:1428 start_codon:yes stop_codon:yes gene_type:complete